MGSKRVFAISGRRRGFGRAVAFLGLLVLCLAGCGRSGHGAATDPEKASDVGYLNTILGQEMTLIDAYDRALPHLHGSALAVGQQLRGQDQVHVDAVTKAIRGVGGETEAEATELESPSPKTREEALLLVYEEENAALDEALGSNPHLNTMAPRTLTVSLAANHAQHLVALRQLFGEDLAESVPQAFESGDEPAPTPASKAR